MTVTAKTIMLHRRLIRRDAKTNCVNAEAEIECNEALDLFVMVGHAEPRQAGKVKTMAAGLASASASDITLLASSTDGIFRPASSGSSSLDQFGSKTEQLENAEDRLGMLELSRLKLGVVKPLLDRLGLSPPVFLQQPGGLIHRQFLLFLSDDFHILISGVLLPLCLIDRLPESTNGNIRKSRRRNYTRLNTCVKTTSGQAEYQFEKLVGTARRAVLAAFSGGKETVNNLAVNLDFARCARAMTPQHGVPTN